MIVSAVHDIAECIVGDITPHDNVTPEDKHKREMDAMEKLVKNLPGGYMFKYIGEPFLFVLFPNEKLNKAKM